MKRVLASIMVFSCLTLTVACSDAPKKEAERHSDSVEILQNKGDTTPNEARKAIKMVNVDGKLYYETNAESKLDARCGVSDGNFEKKVTEFEIPQNDGESNFSESSSYQLGTEENTIEIPIGETWMIFKKIDSNRDVLKYKYCYTVNGTLPNAANDSTYLVLADVLGISFEDASYQLLGSDLNKMKDIYVLPIAD